MTEMLKLQSKYFGEIEYEAKDVIRFPAGIIGFEEEQAFLLLPFEGSGGGMLCLQSVATPALAFVVMDAFSLMPDYAPVLQKAELEQFGGGRLFHGGILVGQLGVQQLAAEDGDLRRRGNGQADPASFYGNHGDGNILSDHQGLAGLALQNQHVAASSPRPNSARGCRIS